LTKVVDAFLYAGRGVRSSPIANGENSGDGDRSAISKEKRLDLWNRQSRGGGMKNSLGGEVVYRPIYFSYADRLRNPLEKPWARRQRNPSLMPEKIQFQTKEKLPWVNSFIFIITHDGICLICYRCDPEFLQAQVVSHRVLGNGDSVSTIAAQIEHIIGCSIDLFY
jgi:hypothetical protein